VSWILSARRPEIFLHCFFWQISARVQQQLVNAIGGFGRQSYGARGKEDPPSSKWRPQGAREPGSKPEGGAHGAHFAQESAAVWIDGLVEIDPEDAGEVGYRRSERQEQDDGPDGVFGDPPAGNGPEQGGNERDDR
jgi:hypothetical protein